eukprot:2587029-Karenia_brevis.AAC.1
MPASDGTCTEDLVLNVINLSTAISVCVKGGQWQRVAPVSDEMHKEVLSLDVSPNVSNFNEDTSCRKRVGRLQYAMP